MQNARLDGAQEAGIKIAGRNINNLRYTDDTTLMAESKELRSWVVGRGEKDRERSLRMMVASWFCYSLEA